MNTNKSKDVPVRSYHVYVDGKLEATIAAYTMKSACHQAKQRFGGKGDLLVQEI